MSALAIAPPRLDLPWLIRLRWWAVAGQLLALAVVRWALHESLPWLWLLALAGLTAGTNLALARRRHHPTSTSTGPREDAIHTRDLTDRSGSLAAAILTLDALTLTGMLAASGGPTSPATIFFVLHVALGALLLRPRAAWSLAALTVGLYGALFVLPVHPLGEHCACAGWSLHLVGMWLAYALTAGFVVHFVGGLSEALRAGDRQRDEIARHNAQLATLSAFAAGAAHDLGTPLATIGLAAKELSRAVERSAPPAALRDDAALIVHEVARCRQILSDIAARSGESSGEMPVTVRVDDLIRAALASLPPHATERIAVTVDGALGETPLVAPRRALEQVIANLLRNALESHDAARCADRVELIVRREGRLHLIVRDRGGGVPSTVLDRLGEPFLTTRRAEGGLGLGLYLAVNYADRAGGTLRLERRDGGGTEAQLQLPLDIVHPEAA